MATATRKTTTFRKVVSLHAEDEKRLQELVREEQSSAGEVARRLLRSHESAQNKQEETGMQALFAKASAALDVALEAIRSARIEVAATNERVRQQREQAA